MQYLKKKESKFELYKYKFDTFDNFVSLKSSLANGGVMLVCDFSTESEFLDVRKSLMGNYVFLRKGDDKTFLFSKQRNFRPFKKVLMRTQEKKCLSEVAFPVFEEEKKGSVRCVVSKKKKHVLIVDEYGKNVNGLMPEVVNAIKKLGCSTFMCEGRIGYTGPKKKNFFDENGSFFVMVGDVFFLDGRDISEENFLFRKQVAEGIGGFGNLLFLGEQTLINYVEELDGGVLRYPRSKYDVHTSFLVGKEG